MTTIQYTLSDIEDIKHNGINYNLDESIISIIQKISQQVGSPEYVKTPKFLKKENKSHHKKLPDREYEDWETIRHFVPTQRVVHEGIERSIDVIRKTLNKITSNTYETMYPIIIEEIDKVLLSQQHDLVKLGTTIFSIVSETSFYSNMYAELFSKLYHKYDFIHKSLYETLNSFQENTKQIEYCNPDTNYDLFCKNNKENTRRKAVAVFLVNLTKHSIVEVSEICEIIHNIQERMFYLIKIENNNEIVDELSEITGSMILSGKDILHTSDKWCKIVNNVNSISKMKPKEQVSLTNKTVFKHMDIIDHLNT